MQTLRKVAFKFLNNLFSKATLKSWILTFFKYYFSVFICKNHYTKLKFNFLEYSFLVLIFKNLNTKLNFNFLEYSFSVLIPTKAIEATKARRAMPRLSQASLAQKDLILEIQGVRRKKKPFLFVLV